MKKIIFLLFLLQVLFVPAFSQVKVQNLLTENLSNPIDLDIQQPRFSWQLVSDKRNVTQTGYEIKMTTGKTIIWNSGRISSDQNVHVPYAGPALQSGHKYFWQVRIWDNHGIASAWAEPGFFQMGLLNVSDWKAKWIEPGFVEDSMMR